ncbi:PAS domain-containing sensor histidine kinase [Brevibacillus dissolubilis]|uniref:PAS domain-containing sensor histidine kinase n=1 Tax=Brevibacillus dissolubilis TaxID=1844116 RepID=UPI00159BE8C7|nr:ATP-binding protein [Brevibacillus dissolubilis]
MDINSLYNFLNVTLSIFLIVLASYLTLLSVEQASRTSGDVRRLLLITGTLMLTSGISGMDYLASLSMGSHQLTNWLMNLLSLAIILSVSIVIVLITGRQKITTSKQLTSSLMVGVALIGIHQIGISTADFRAVLSYNTLPFLLALFISFASSFITIWVINQFRISPKTSSPSQKLLGAVMIGLGQAGLHYTTLYSMKISKTTLVKHINDNQELFVSGYAVGITTTIILILVLVIAFLDRGLAIQAAKVSDLRYRSLFEHNSDMVFSFDLVGRILSINPSVEKTLGYSLNELINRPFTKLVAPEDLEKALNYMYKSVNGERQEFELFLHHKQRNSLEIQLTTVPIITNDQIVGLYAIAKDVTERKKTEELLRKSDKLSVVGELAAGIAHEIRNPLTALKGFVQLLQSKSNEDQQYFEIMQDELDRINFIVSELLLLAKPQAVNYLPNQLHQVLQDVITLLETQAIMNNIQILIEFEEVNPVILCEEKHLKQVFINILKNAIEAMDRGGDIRIITKLVPPNQVLVRFIDQGVGISPELLKKLGEPFYTTKEKGTGLGIMVSTKIIEEHNGKMQIQSEQGKGTMVDVILPLYEEVSLPETNPSDDRNRNSSMENVREEMLAGRVS